MVKEYKEAVLAYEKWWDDFDECFELGISNAHLPNIDEIINRWQELGDKKESAFNNWVVVDQACINCGFPDLIDHEDLKYYIQMYEWGYDSYEIPTPDAIDAWNRGELEDF